jgi:phosphoribosylformylglycinamidine synthase subunit PurS
VIYAAEVRVMLKAGVNDPQGLSIQKGLHALGFQEVANVRAGKLIRLHLEAEDEAQAAARITSMCEKLLANPVIEEYAFEIERAGLPTPPAG